jgi:hypothetical protein
MTIPATRLRLLALLLAAALLPGLSAGCSHLSVRHMNRQPWSVGTPQSLEMKYWRFEYETVPLHDKFGIRGVAYPVTGQIPDWAAWVDELWLAAYLSDSRGRVIAKDLSVYLPRPLQPSRGVGFEFILQPEDLGRAGHLYVTFGYRMVLTESAEPDGEHQPFFANEGALSRL